MMKFSTVLLIMMICCWISMAEASEYFKYKDPKRPLSVRIKDLMKRMTLEEKIGQMAQIDRTVASNEVIKKYLIGSVMGGGGSHASPKTWVDMVNDYQNGSLSTRLGIPLIYGIDAVHGHNDAYKATIFPHNVGLGVTRDPELIKKIGAATALEVRATEITCAFAPCVAVCRDPRWGRCFESFSEDPNIVREMTEIISGLQGEIPNNDAVRKGVASIMVSYSSLNGVRMHRNRELITGFLKNTLKFRGFVISDFQGIDKMTDPIHANYTWSIQESIGAGIDMIMIGFNYSEFIDRLTYLENNKFIPLSRIDDAVRRILRVKFVMGLFENPLADLSMEKYLGYQDHRDLAREAVRKSLVLLKNGKSCIQPMLPLQKISTKILIAGTHADNIGNQCGAWTIERHGESGNITKGTTILSAVKNAVDPTTEVVYVENPTPDFIKSNNFSYAIVVTGEYQLTGDSQDLTMPVPGPTTIKNVCESVKCVVVLMSGRPVVIEPYVSSMDALVAAWLPGCEGQGVTDVLFGDYGFTGKLAYTWFKTVDQLPMNVGDPHYDPLYPFGYGLTTEPSKGL
ncbi:uncharacterized protein LOC143627198 [Bidens hawaiensis]|uniref:uncharacterized protein LOC143627198 n=1 Tax=Bidens hawaiensis TaxID=980011 RepID=UPI00404B5C2C